MISRVRSLVVGLVLQLCQPRPTEKIWEWASHAVWLNEKASPGHPGFYDWRLTPHARAIQETHTDPDWDEHVIIKSSQIAITEAVLNIVRWSVVHQPMNTLYATHSAKQAQKICKIRLLPSLRESRGTNKVIGEVAEDELSNLMLNLPSMTIHLTGGGSSGELTSNPFGVGIFDEADEHPEPPKGEMHNVDKVRERLKTVPGAKLYIIGRPKTTNHILAREYKTGTCEKLFVPCPHPLCGGFQELVCEQLKFAHCKDLTGEYDLQRVAAETYYECIHCRQPIHEDQKSWMVQHGEWRITNPRHSPRKRSSHVSDLYSLFVPWSKLALELIDANQSGSLAKLQAFRTGRLGIPWEEKQAEVKEADVLKLRGTYKRGEVPWIPDVITMTCDKQGDVLKWSKAAIRWPGEIAIIQYGDAAYEDDLIEIAQEPIAVPGLEEPMRVKIGLIDEGFRAKREVRPFCLRSAGLFHPSKGRAGTMQVRHLVWESMTEFEGEPLVVYHYDDDAFKKDLYKIRILKFDDIAKGLNRAPRLWFPADCERGFLAEHMMEKHQEEKGSWGYSKWTWIKLGPNDYGDCTKLHLVLWSQIAAYFKPADAPPPEPIEQVAQAA
jgi:hypothetical protein